MNAAIAQRSPETARLITDFRTKVDILVEKGPYAIETVSRADDLDAALRLRHRVFRQEMLGEPGPGYDVDEFDALCDHLVIRNRADAKIVGTYRLNSSLVTQKFYSAHEFVLDDLLKSPGVKLELGRACIDPEHRNGIVLSLLWRGIAEYVGRTDTDLLFGCGTVQTEDPVQAAALYQFFRERGHMDHPYHSRPQPDYVLPGLQEAIRGLGPLDSETVAQAESLLPPLCRMYLKAGAWIGGVPAWDPEFRCIDFLIILPTRNINQIFWRRYGGK